MADDVETQANQIIDNLNTQVSACQAISEAITNAFNTMKDSGQTALQAMSDSWGGDNATQYFNKQSNNISNLFSLYNQLYDKNTEAYKSAVNNARTQLSALGINPDNIGLSAM